jgi:hypothetical protein
MAEAQQITITLAPATLAALKDMGYELYVMRAFDTTNAAGKPLVWVATTLFAENIMITFDVEYQAYISTSQVIPNGVVLVSTTAPVALGQTATIDANGTITVTQGGNPAGVTIVNGGTAPYTTGLAATVNGNSTAAIFAEPLYGLAADIAAPLDRFLLTFSTQGVAAGTLVEHAMSQSLLVDMTGTSQRAVTFDINTGWSAGGATWATPVPAGANLTPVLVHETPLGRRSA